MTETAIKREWTPPRGPKDAGTVPHIVERKCATAQTAGRSASIFQCITEARRSLGRFGARHMDTTTTANLAWVSTSAHTPHDRQRVYARVAGGLPKKVTYYARPTPRWEGSSIVYDSQYFTEWAALEVLRKSA